MGIGALPSKLSGVLYVIFGKPACDCTIIGRDDVHRIAPPERAFHPRRACGEQALAPGERARPPLVDVDCTLHRQPPGKTRPFVAAAGRGPHPPAPPPTSTSP